MRVCRGAGWLLLPVLLFACSRPPLDGPETASPPQAAEPVAAQPDQPEGKEVSDPGPEGALPATVRVDQRHGYGWRPVTVLDAYASPGPSTVRLHFSKPVRKREVELALLAAQSLPLRGLMEWTDDRTLIWQVAELSQRLDFLLGGAHDTDGLPLPAGIPSLRVGEPPRLVAVDLTGPAGPTETVLGILPPDIVTASLSSDGQAVNLMAWTPGTTRWDWETIDLHFDLQQGSLKGGRVEAGQTRLPAAIEHGAVSPNGLLVAGVRSQGEANETNRADLVVMDIRGGRLRTFPGVIGLFRGPGQTDLTARLAWSPDSARVAALSHAGQEQSSDLVLVDVATGEVTLPAAGLSVRSDGTRLSWSADGRFLLAGNWLVEQASGTAVPLAGRANQASGAWEPGGSRLLYSLQDWGDLFLVDPERVSTEPLGEGMVVAWSAPGRALVIRWPGSSNRYVPPGGQEEE